MKDIRSAALRHCGGRLEILDQQRLPHAEIWIPVGSTDEMIAAIRALKVRGAPLIGVAAALWLGKLAESGAGAEAVRRDAMRLREARPTAVNLMHAVDRILADPVRAPAIAEGIFDEDVELCAAIARHGAELVRDGDGILTHCNAGALATAGVGTALGVLARAHGQGKRIHVYVDETRPLLQGARLTAWEMERAGIPHTLITDSMSAILMSAGKIQRVFVGADRIAANGDAANKVGTYGVAVLAKAHGIPFYVAAPTTTVDRQCASGAHIPIEERSPDEIRGYGESRWGNSKSPVWNPAFDVTPAACITALVLETGVHSIADFTRRNAAR